ncbi:MAG: amidohydrolase family protein [Xanthobacter sp.]
MRLPPRNKYRDLLHRSDAEEGLAADAGAQASPHGMGCACHTPEIMAIYARLDGALSRRSVLGGLAAGLALPLLSGLPKPAHANPSSRLLLTNARIFDGVEGRLIEGRDVLVEQDRIADLPAAGEGAAETLQNVEVIDCGGRTIMPGLIDSHWHALLAAVPQTVAMTADIPFLHLVAAEEAGKTLMRGFTTVRDVGGPAFALKRAIDEKRLPGPRIFPSGAMITQTGGHGDFRSRNELPHSFEMGLSVSERAGIASIADGADQALRSTREQLLLGASQIKVMLGGGVSSLHDPLDSIQFTPAEIRAAVQAAADWGTYVCAHVYMSGGINRAIDHGVKCIEHGQLADEETARRIAGEGIWWSIQPFLSDLDANPKSLPEQQLQQKQIAEGTVRCFEWGQKFKAKMAWGTDILFNPAGTRGQGRQLAKIASWFGAAETLRMATSHSGELLKLSGPRNPYPGDLGVIRRGAWADLLVVDGDPLENIDLIGDPERNMKLIMKGGQIFKNTLAA